MDASQVTCDGRHVNSSRCLTHLSGSPSMLRHVTTGRSLLGAASLLLGLLALTACQSDVARGTPHRTLAPRSAQTWRSPLNDVRGIHKIKHVVMVMQENRSFDSYFGTYPGADGIPMRHGRSVACESAAPGLPCRHLYVDHADVNGGGPHTFRNHVARRRPRPDGRLPAAGRAREQALPRRERPVCAATGPGPTCSATTRRATSRTTGRSRTGTCSRTTCSSRCAPGACPSTCGRSPSGRRTAPPAPRRRAPTPPSTPGDRPPGRLGRHARGSRPRRDPVFAWTDLTYLLHRHHVSWGYYVQPGSEPDCRRTSSWLTAPGRPAAVDARPVEPAAVLRHGPAGPPAPQHPADPDFFHQARTGHLPAVSWVIPSGRTASTRRPGSAPGSPT